MCAATCITCCLPSWKCNVSAAAFPVSPTKKPMPFLSYLKKSQGGSLYRPHSLQRNGRGLNLNPCSSGDDCLACLKTLYVGTRIIWFHCITILSSHWIIAGCHCNHLGLPIPTSYLYNIKNMNHIFTPCNLLLSVQWTPCLIPLKHRRKKVNHRKVQQLANQLPEGAKPGQNSQQESWNQETPWNPTFKKPARLPTGIPATPQFITLQSVKMVMFNLQKSI